MVQVQVMPPGGRILLAKIQIVAHNAKPKWRIRETNEYKTDT